MITKSTNYQTIGTCVCIGENLAVTLPVTVDTVQIPCLSTKEMILHVGDGADWDQRRAFEWGLLCGVARRNGDQSTVDICLSWIERIKARRG